MVGRVGIEPTTSRLKAECSTSELTPRRCRSPLLEPAMRANNTIARMAGSNSGLLLECRGDDTG